MQEEAVRRYIWEKNLQFVDQHNMEYRQGKHTFDVAMNRFADLVNENFPPMYAVAADASKQQFGCHVYF